MMNPLEQTLVLISMGALMVGMGTTLDWSAFKLITRRPRHLALGVSMQFGLLPLLAFSLATLLELSPEASLALILVGCTPGGASSNMYTWFAKGDVPLSLSMTMLSTLVAVFLMPLLVSFYGTNLPLGELIIPWKQISGSLLFVLVPVAFGLFLRAKGVKYLLVIQRAGSILGICAVFLMLASWLPSLANKLLNEFAPQYLAVLVLGNAGFLIGYVLVRIFGFSPKVARTISLETGLQNTLLTFTIMSLSFSTAYVDKVGWVPLMYGACIMSMGFIWMLVFRYFALKEIRGKQQRIRENKHAVA